MSHAVNHSRRILAVGAALVALALAFVVTRPTEAAPSGQVEHLPLSLFIDAQGSADVWFTPEPALFAWTGRDPDYHFMGWIDYVGAADKWLVDNGYDPSGTTVTGTFTSRDVGDGLVEYSANVHAKNALAWCVRGFDANGDPDFATMLFGGHVQDVADDVGARAIGSANFKATWVQDADEPIADVNLAQNYCAGWDDDGNCVGGWPYRPDGFQLLNSDMRGTATGPLHVEAGLGPDGTPGKLVISQTNSNPQAFGHGNGGNGWGFPAEVVDLRVVGN